MSLPPLYALRAFACAAQYGSFSQAATVLHVTPGAISRHIRTLEMLFGCELFIRRGPKVEVSAAGHVLATQLQSGFDSLERACAAFSQQSKNLRLKAPSTLTMRWLLDVLQAFREKNSTPEVAISSVWMATDSVDFSREPFDCAILLGNGDFGPGTESRLLFKEWLIPVCSPALKPQAQQDLASCELIHPTADRRDWQRWLRGVGLTPGANLWQGKVFDTLEQGNMAAISGHGISVGDLLLSLNALRDGLLALPFPQAVATGDGYYFVWPANATFSAARDTLLSWLRDHLPALPTTGIDGLILMK
ncbi:MAG: LysR substrate-binding domain-containing protein [Pantoea sp.]|uniref:LysR substrate-binding domain-containing protein n=1 Tax=Pantoea sp. TaxID=69393 RepID=UPI0039E6C880